MRKIIAILPAAGVGKRMNPYKKNGVYLPKQYFLINKKTVLEHSVHEIIRQSSINKILIVISSKDYWFRNLSIYNHPKVNFVIGGKSRFESVLCALRAIKNSNKWVLIHDAVRPCLRKNDLLNLLSVRSKTNIGGILVTPAKDTIKYGFIKTRRINCTVNRKNLLHALTPQLFSYRLLIDCCEKFLLKNRIATDESSVLEYFGYKPLFVFGRSDNIKITYPEDLNLVKFFFKKEKY